MTRQGEIHVLVVEDHAMVSESLVRMLNAQPDIAVTGVASTGAAARQSVETQQPDVVVLDQDLPDSTGTAVAGWLRDCYPHVNVVLLTGWADDSVLAAAIEAGCAGYVRKTSAFAELVGAVRQVHAGEAAFPADVLIHALSRMGGSGSKLGKELSDREMEILRLLSEGCTNRVVAESLHLSVNTIRNHVQLILRKLEAHSKLEAVMTAQRKGILRRR
ncbi:MAG TPA: response regulator transcription factor [Acidimicrobiales bacterium]|nr:response regulator transcription factor [Acidimicrobiales bacterium]